jgi:hypothetical protein
MAFLGIGFCVAPGHCRTALTPGLAPAHANARARPSRSCQAGAGESQVFLCFNIGEVYDRRGPETWPAVMETYQQALAFMLPSARSVWSAGCSRRRRSVR